ncbi:ATP-binding cassette domain-containing protein [Rhodococcus sp. HS-D2]|uniref:ATP-binding cassette domain-containing protein n=1 Tax=Rhodococcus sp. HS-D2 TaxID=1384636 RepID=UPI0007D90C53|nr:ATP-binding cassette domain-containing protein [Rhodococcus sp. HS-D2]
MAHIDVTELGYSLPDGRALFHSLNFKLGQGERAALVGPNGVGKSTLVSIVAGELSPHEGSIHRSGSLGVMPQFIGKATPGLTIRDLLVATASPAVKVAASALSSAERAMVARNDEESQMSYAQALADWSDLGGFDVETSWDLVTKSTLGVKFAEAQSYPVEMLSGGEQKRLVLEALFTGPHSLLILDEPDNYLDVAGKEWLEARLTDSARTVLFISHDRQLVANSATKIITLEPTGAGAVSWTHGGSLDSYEDARVRRNDRLDEMRKRWDEERTRLRTLVNTLREKAKYNDGMSARYQAAVTRLNRFEQAGPPVQVPRPQRLTMRLQGGRTGKRALCCDQLSVPDRFRPFDAELFHGDRVAVIGPNGTGKTHFLALLATESNRDSELQRTSSRRSITYTGGVQFGARVRTGYFSQTQVRPDLAYKTLLEVLHQGDNQRDGRGREDASRALARYGLARAAEQRYDELSGGQQARFQILLLELSGATMLLLDEPTDNLDFESAEALEVALSEFQGTVLAVTHDRWFSKSFDRYLIFGSDGSVVESEHPIWR